MLSKHLAVAVVAVLAFGVAACGDDAPPEPDGDIGTLTVTSEAFADGQTIPQEYTCDGADTSLPLAWQGAPEATVAYAIVMDDPDAPGGTFVHWVVANIAPEHTAVPKGASGAGIAAVGGIEGKDDFDETGYRGPCPPKGDEPHEYQVKVYALDATFEFVAPPTKRDLLIAMDGHALARGLLTGTYGR